MNKTSYAILILILITVLTCIGTGCNKKDDNPPPVEFTIMVDSIHHADTIQAGEDFDIDFYGTIGDSDCYEFQEFKDSITNGQATIELIGKHTFRDNCTTGIQYMNPYTLSISNLTAGNWTLTITQPQGTAPTESQFFVK